MTLLEIKKHRSDRYGDTTSGSFNKNEYRLLIKAHSKTLRKYVGNFGLYLGVWTGSNRGNYKAVIGSIGEDAFDSIIHGKRSIKISEVLKLYMDMDLKDDFQEYLIRKTHLSYELYPHKPKPATIHDDHGPMYTKFAEFVHLVLAEYIILHNYMVSSRLKDKSINSIDEFLKNV